MTTCLIACTGVAAVGDAATEDPRDGDRSEMVKGVGPVVISEIMYHPVLEDAALEQHEFIEIYNRSDAAVSLGGWKLGGGMVSYTFAATVTLPAHRYLVVAKDPERLATDVPPYALERGALAGPYAGDLDNGGGALALVDADGKVMDSVKYDDEFPWPLAADDLGAGEEWLPPSLLPLERHRYRGVSLERVNADLPSTEVANWAPSAVDGATPGRANGAASAMPASIVEQLTLSPQPSAETPIRKEDQVVVFARLSYLGQASDPAVESFVDNLGETGEATALAPMTPAAGGYTTTLPARPDNSVVRYRILARPRAGAEREILSPRSGDPVGWYAYFVSPRIASQSPLYQMFISPRDWGQLWDNIYVPDPTSSLETPQGPNLGCEVNARWNARVPMVLVEDGQVFDALGRYAGGRWGRRKGTPIAGWPGALPTSGPLLALSWNLSFPAYNRPGKRHSIGLKKLSAGPLGACPGIHAAVEGRLMAAAGLPASSFQFVRVHLNGYYYQYMVDIDGIDTESLQRYHGSGQPIGGLFKAEGTLDDQGPWGPSNGALLSSPSCGFTVPERYQYIYRRETPAWKGIDNQELVALLEALHAARKGGTTALRKFFADTFDVSLLLDHLALRNWSGTSDDSYHNYMLYRRPDGKWIMLSEDYDGDFGLWYGPGGSFFIGQEGNPTNRDGQWNYFKDSFFASHAADMRYRLRQLDKSLLDPANGLSSADNVKALLEQAMDALKVDEWAESPAQQTCAQLTGDAWSLAMCCDIAKELARVNAWPASRHESLLTSLGP